MGEFSHLPMFSADPKDIKDVDAAKRLSDTINNICAHNPLDVVIRSWIAVRLEDGGTDGVLYETRRDAVQHQRFEQQCAYVFLRDAPGGMPVREAYVYLKFHRAAYDAGMRLTDPDHKDGGLQPRMPISNLDIRSQISRLHQKRKVR